MYTVYILLSKKDNKLYVGCTSDITKRVRSHNNGEVKATKYRCPLILLHIEDFSNKSDAFNRERFLKTLWSARFKKKLVDTYKKHNNIL